MGNIIYQERLSCKRIRKVRIEEQSEDKDSVHYVSDKDLEEESVEISFLLGTVVGQERFTNPSKTYSDNLPPIVDVETLTYSYYVLMSYEEFDKIMTDFIDKQNIYVGNVESIDRFLEMKDNYASNTKESNS